jgi:hypothetical protein
MAASLSAAFSHLEPLRVRPERRLPADWSLPGHLAGPRGQVPGGREDTHVDADLGDDHLGGAGLDAWDRAQKLNRWGERGELRLDRLGEPLDLLVEEVEVGEDRPDQQGVQRVEAALERLFERRIFLRSLPRASSASSSGSVVPWQSASSIARPPSDRTCAFPRIRLPRSPCRRVTRLIPPLLPLTPRGGSSWSNLAAPG